MGAAAARTAAAAEAASASRSRRSCSRSSSSGPCFSLGVVAAVARRRAAARFFSKRCCTNRGARGAGASGAACGSGRKSAGAPDADARAEPRLSRSCGVTPTTRTNEPSARSAKTDPSRERSCDFGIACTVGPCRRRAPKLAGSHSARRSSDALPRASCALQRALWFARANLQCFRTPCRCSCDAGLPPKPTDACVSAGDSATFAPCCHFARRPAAARFFSKRCCESRKSTGVASCFRSRCVFYTGFFRLP